MAKFYASQPGDEECRVCYNLWSNSDVLVQNQGKVLKAWRQVSSTLVNINNKYLQSRSKSCFHKVFFFFVFIKTLKCLKTVVRLVVHSTGYVRIRPCSIKVIAVFRFWAMRNRTITVGSRLLKCSDTKSISKTNINTELIGKQVQRLVNPGLCMIETF